MKFSPKTDDEINALNLIEPGIYDFEVMDAKDKTSKSGNEMIELRLKVWDKNGLEHHIYDYLLEALAFKLKHFSKVSGLLVKYEHGTIFATDCIGKSGKVEVIIQKGQPNPNGGVYSDKNSIKDYIESSMPSSAVTKPKDDFIDSELPF